MFSVYLSNDNISVIILVVGTTLQVAKIEFAYPKVVVIQIS